MAEFKFNVGDKVRILNGNNLIDYFGGWTNKMAELVGKTGTITARYNYTFRPCPGYKLDICPYSFDERALELVEAKDPVELVTAEKITVKNLSKKEFIEVCQNSVKNVIESAPADEGPGRLLSDLLLTAFSFRLADDIYGRS